MRTTNIEPHLSYNELKDLYQTAQDKEVSKRWHILWLVQTQQTTAVHASQFLGHAKSWGIYWIKQYNEQGPEVITQKKMRNPRLPVWKLTPEVKEALFEAFSHPFPVDLGGGLWSGPKVVLYLDAKHGIQVNRRTGSRLLRQAGYTVQSGRPRHIGTSDEEREVFKKKVS